MSGTKLILEKTDIDKTLEFGHIDMDKEMIVSITRGKRHSEVIYIDVQDIKAIIQHLEYHLNGINR